MTLPCSAPVWILLSTGRTRKILRWVPSTGDNYTHAPVGTAREGRPLPSPRLRLFTASSSSAQPATARRLPAPQFPDADASCGASESRSDLQRPKQVAKSAHLWAACCWVCLVGVEQLPPRGPALSSPAHTTPRAPALYARQSSALLLLSSGEAEVPDPHEPGRGHRALRRHKRCGSHNRDAAPHEAGGPSVTARAAFSGSLASWQAHSCLPAGSASLG